MAERKKPLRRFNTEGLWSVCINVLLLGQMVSLLGLHMVRKCWSRESLGFHLKNGLKMII